MSKIGKQPLIIKPDVSVRETDAAFIIKGPKGEVLVKKIPYVSVVLNPSVISVKLEKDIKQGRANWGTLRSLLNNALTGVAVGFTKVLEINGVGFRAEIKDRDLILNLGFSHPVIYSLPADITVAVDKNKLVISGFDKDLVSRTAAKIRSFKKPEPYKGKGIKYEDEIIRRKAGKKVVGSGS